MLSESHNFQRSSGQSPVRNECENWSLRFFSGGHQINEVLNSGISLVVGAFDFDGWLGTASGPVMKQAVGQGAAGALVKQDEHGADPGALWGKAVGVVLAGALPKSVTFHSAQVVTEWIEGVLLGRKGKGRLQSFPDWRLRQPAD